MPFPIDQYKETIGDFCRRWQIVEFAVFGSALREDFGPDSDIDVMVTFGPDAQWSFQHWLEMIDELERIFGRRVDLVERRAVETSKNYIRRKHILNHLERVYVAG